MSPKSTSTQRPAPLPSRRIGLAPSLNSASSTASTIAPTCRSLLPEAMRKTSVSTSCSLTSSAMISSALMSDAARAAATASSIARSVAATGLLGSRSGGSGRQAGEGVRGGRRDGCGGVRPRRVLTAVQQQDDEEAEHERDEREHDQVQPGVGVP